MSKSRGRVCSQPTNLINAHLTFNQDKNHLAANKSRIITRSKDNSRQTKIFGL